MWGISRTSTPARCVLSGREATRQLQRHDALGVAGARGRAARSAASDSQRQPKEVHRELTYHPSGRQLYATSNDQTVHLFDTATWERSGRFTWRLGMLKAVAVSPDGTLAAAGGDRGDIVIWDVDS